MRQLHNRPLLAYIAGLALLLWAGAAPGQIPDKFVNLKVLPKKIAKDDLVATMRQFSIGLGVRCNYCHAQADSGKGMDFASDDKKEKTTARAMIKMVDNINNKLIPKAGMKSPAKVQCITCHRGVESPKTLTEVMKDAVRKDGVDAALQKYNELRSKYYGSGSYDFGPGSLNGLADWLARERKDVDGAITVAKSSISRDPAAAESHILLGTLLSMKGDNAAAIESIKHALELDPENRRAKELLKGLQSE
jgi:tetratricopeptide (TPR) repeat protein